MQYLYMYAYYMYMMTKQSYQQCILNNFWQTNFEFYYIYVSNMELWLKPIQTRKKKIDNPCFIVYMPIVKPDPFYIKFLKI